MSPCIMSRWHALTPPHTNTHIFGTMFPHRTEKNTACSSTLLQHMEVRFGFWHVTRAHTQVLLDTCCAERFQRTQKTPQSHNMVLRKSPASRAAARTPSDRVLECAERRGILPWRSVRSAPRRVM